MNRVELLAVMVGFGLVGCTQKSTLSVPVEDTDTDDDTDTEPDTDTDTDTDTDDLDGDGFTVEEGDCDDDDIGVNPARDEDDSDGKDNDCDGRVDEEWDGLTVAQQHESDVSSILEINSTGTDIVREVKLESGYLPLDVTHAVDDGSDDPGWVIIHDDGASYDGDVEIVEPTSVVHVATDGTCTVLAEFTDPDEWVPAVRGIKTHPDGYYVVTGPGALYRVDTDGTTTELTSWGADFSDDTTYELFGRDLAVDLVTGEVGIFDWTGGFATWSEEEGLNILKQADITDSWANWDYLSVEMGDAMDGGGWFGLVVDYEAYEYALYRFNLNKGTWTLKMEWIDTNIAPQSLATNGDNGDIYVSANGGWHRTLWLIDLEADYLDDFYDEATEPNYLLTGIISNY